MPKKTKAAAYRSLFSLKLKEGSIKVVENFEVAGKTKEAAAIAKSFSITKGLLISENESPLLKRSIKNISYFMLNNVKRISSRDIFYSKQVLITEDAVKFINDSYSKAVK
jgi:large subunit ribosomal protein L4